MTRFFQGVIIKMPKKTKYSCTWDPSVVLNRLAEWYPNESLSLEKLTKKSVTRMALVTAQRAQTLHSIKVENFHRDEKFIRIRIDATLKTSKHINTKPVLEIPYYSQPTVCPARALDAYLERTQDLRPKNAKKLFITYKNTHHEATVQSVSRWMKQTLGECGIDTDIFSAHSTRHASTSAAARKNINVHTILKAVGWAQNSATFATYYNRPLMDANDSPFPF